MLDMSADPDAVKAIMDVFTGMYAVNSHTASGAHDFCPASPEFADVSEFLTSPMDDSPFAEFLSTPANASADFFTSPAIFDADRFPDFSGDAPLFGGVDLGMGGVLDKPPSAPAASQPALSLEGMYTMPSPMTPALDPASLHSSPHTNPLPTPGTPGRRPRKSLPTGTRKNITPEALVSLDAPIQTRKYVTPSATSRKEVPTAWLKKKRARSQAFGEEDELEEDLSLNPNDMDAIEAKRRQNTLAARRSRKRKLEYQRELEASVEREKEEKEMWRQRAMLYQALLESHGHEVPSFDTA